MTVNLMKADPDYLIDNLLIPAKARFFKSGNNWLFSTYSFGVIPSKLGPALIDEAIDFVKQVKPNHQVKWNYALEFTSEERLSSIANKFIDSKRMSSFLSSSAVTEIA